MRDESLDMEYPIINLGCKDPYTNVAGDSDLIDNKSVRVSFKAFQFVSSKSEISTLKIVCSVSIFLIVLILSLWNPKSYVGHKLHGPEFASNGSR